MLHTLRRSPSVLSALNKFIISSFSVISRGILRNSSITFMPDYERMLCRSHAISMEASSFHVINQMAALMFETVPLAG